jgi:ABC-type amino acid transport substrate-binding protein
MHWRCNSMAINPRFCGLLLFVVASLAVIARAEEIGLTGVLKKIHDSGEVVIGYRESSIPFSYLNSRGEPIGYSIDLGRSIVDAISNELNGQTLKIRFEPVTSASRFEAVVSAKIDLECGSTTNNTERQKQVSFSPIMFVAGTKLMVKRGSPVESYRDLKGKTVVVTAGTTNEQAIQRLSDRFELGIKIVEEKEHADSFKRLAAGTVDAFAGDDVLLYGLAAINKAAGDFDIVGDFLSYDPYGIMFRKDDLPLSNLIRHVFEEMAQSRDLTYNYDRWFRKKLPNGDALNLPMSAQLEEIFRTMGSPD